MEFETIASGLGFLEGPVALRSGGLAVTSIDRGQVLTLADPRAGGEPRVLSTTGGGPNGAAEGAGGHLYLAQNGGKPPAARAEPVVTGGIQAVDPDGTVSWVSQDPVSPNDICFGPDGHIYVTDPTRPRSKQDGRLWRCDPASSEADLLASLPWYPNGLGFGLESDALYVASTDEQRIVRFPLDDHGLGKPETFVQMTRSGPDGFAFDADGNIIIGGISLDGSPGDVQVWSAEGELLERYEPGQDTFYTNLALLADGGMALTSSGAGDILLTPPGAFRPLALHPFREADGGRAER